MRLLKLLVAAEAALIVAIGSIWWFAVRDDPRATHGNDGLRGSIAPAGQRLPDLNSIKGIIPPVPAASSLTGAPLLIVATCFECQSGDVVGGALRRLAAPDLPGDTRIVVVGWGQAGAAWHDRWSLPKRFVVHEATTPAAIAQAKQTLGVDETGYAYLYDGRGVWRSSFAVQLMQSEDIVHDMRRLD